MTLPEHPERARPDRPQQDIGRQEAGETADGGRDIAAPVTSQPAAADPAASKSAASQPTVAQLAGDYAAKAGLHRSSNGNIDVLKSAGGIQGIAESILPGLVFLIAFTIDRENLAMAVTASLAVAAVFTVARLVQRKPLTQALAGEETATPAILKSISPSFIISSKREVSRKTMSTLHGLTFSSLVTLNRISQGGLR